MPCGCSPSLEDEGHLTVPLPSPPPQEEPSSPSSLCFLQLVISVPHLPSYKNFHFVLLL